MNEKIAQETLKMQAELEKARKMSEKGETIWALSNGHKIIITKTRDAVKENPSYWVCSIFEHGHRVEA